MKSKHSNNEQTPDLHDGGNTQMKKLTLVYQPDNQGWWLVSVKELKGCHTQGKTLTQARSRIEEALELFVDELGSIALRDEVVRPCN